MSIFSKSWCRIAVAVVHVGIPAAAHATFSVVAADQWTGQIGAAGASCIGAQDLGKIYSVVPGVGAVNSQARSSIAGRNEAVKLLKAGLSAPEVMSRVTSTDFDYAPEYRQYGVVDVKGGVAVHTGERTSRDTGAAKAAADGFVVAVQGNTLTSDAVVTNASRAFVEGADACDLAERLMRALEAARKDGGGDKRCVGDTKKMTSADSAFLRVDRPSGGPLVQLTVMGTMEKDAVLELRKEFDKWRMASGQCQPRNACRLNNP